ncbi:MAG: hypothetical protein HKL79_03435 [Thermoplasmata archaeon]|nr:hypothetical protein [Thermoplasmata archaeon]
MGDLQTLLERFEDLRGKEEAQKASEHLISGRFTLRDLRTQLDSLGQMGSLSKLMSFFPGLGPAKIDDSKLNETQVQLRKFRTMLDSMTSAELDDANIIKSERAHRIARGSGHKPPEVRALLRYYETTKKAAHGITSNRRLRRQIERQMSQGGTPPHS